jgi:DNA helicase-2/ATP-dependent DNA helicase PcrA
MIILAGAGSGKTRVLTYKVIYLIEQGVDPNNILMVTFTNKAASEMKERMQKFFQQKGEFTLPTISTFHALCAKILRIDGQWIGIPKNFLIYDSQDQKDAIKEAFEILGISSIRNLPEVTFRKLSPKPTLSIKKSSRKTALWILMI